MDINNILKEFDFEKEYVGIGFNRNLSSEKCNLITQIISKKRDLGFGENIFTLEGLESEREIRTQKNNDKNMNKCESFLFQLKTEEKNKPKLFKEILEEILKLTDSINIYSFDMKNNKKSKVISIDPNYEN